MNQQTKPPGAISDTHLTLKAEYETPRLESYGDASEISKALAVDKIDDIDIAGLGGSFIQGP